VGIAIAVLWSLMGAEDYISLRKHGKRTTEVERQVEEKFKKSGLDLEA
jgi:hypothetical protein